MDVQCIVCGEPWDQYHVMHDMPKWQARLFNLGAGCPACEGDGQPPDDVFINALSSRLINGSDEGPGGGAIAALTQDHDEPRPKWAPPADITKWECNQCNCKVVETHDEDGYPYTAFDFKQSSLCYHDQWKLERDDDNLSPTTIEGQPYCAICTTTCDHCGEECVSADCYTHQEGMRVHELCSEECLMAWEREQAEEWWSNGAKSDVERTLVRLLEAHYQDDESGHDPDEIAEHLLDEWEQNNGLPDYEFTGEGARFDTDAIAQEIFGTLDL